MFLEDSSAATSAEVTKLHPTVYYTWVQHQRDSQLINPETINPETINPKTTRAIRRCRRYKRSGRTLPPFHRRYDVR